MQTLAACSGAFLCKMSVMCVWGLAQATCALQLLTDALSQQLLGAAF